MSPCKPSKTTEQLCDLLRRRDALGQKKYGATLDRDDLHATDWLQHQIEEQLDGAAYGLCAKRVIEAQEKHLRTLEDRYSICLTALIKASYILCNEDVGEIGLSAYALIEDAIHRAAKVS